MKIKDWTYLSDQRTTTDYKVDFYGYQTNRLSMSCYIWTSIASYDFAMCREYLCDYFLRKNISNNTI